MLSMDSLRVFVAAAETENFSRAAKRLSMSQPAVSQHVQSLESQLGVQLFERHGRRIRLSAEGETLLPLARDLLRASKHIEEIASNLSGQVVGHLYVGCSTTSGKYVLPRLLARYRERYPLVKGEVKVGSRTQVLEWLQSGEVDIIVTSEQIHRSGIHYRRFFEDEIVLVVPVNHPWAQRGSVPPSDLYGERFVMREMTSGTYMALKEELDQAGIDVEQLERVLTLWNSEAIIMAVEEGIGLGFVPRVAAERCAALGSVKILTLDGVPMKRWLYLGYSGTRPKTPALHAFCDFMESIDPECTCLRPAWHSPLWYEATEQLIAPK
jgi:Transcriptional regulator